LSLSSIQDAGFIMLAMTLVVMATHPYSRGGMRTRGGSFAGPVWFLMAVIAVSLIAFGTL